MNHRNLDRNRSSSTINKKHRLLLMGQRHVGKTSMRSMIFSNYKAEETVRLQGVQQFLSDYSNSFIFEAF